MGKKEKELASSSPLPSSLETRRKSYLRTTPTVASPLTPLPVVYVIDDSEAKRKGLRRRRKSEDDALPLPTEKKNTRRRAAENKTSARWSLALDHAKKENARGGRADGALRPKRISRVGFFISWRAMFVSCLLYTSPSPRDRTRSRMPSSA